MFSSFILVCFVLFIASPRDARNCSFSFILCLFVCLFVSYLFGITTLPLSQSPPCALFFFVWRGQSVPKKRWQRRREGAKRETVRTKEVWEVFVIKPVWEKQPKKKIVDDVVVWAICTRCEAGLLMILQLRNRMCFFQLLNTLWARFPSLLKWRLRTKGKGYARHDVGMCVCSGLAKLHLPRTKRKRGLFVRLHISFAYWINAVPSLKAICCRAKCACFGVHASFVWKQAMDVAWHWPRWRRRSLSWALFLSSLFSPDGLSTVFSPSNRYSSSSWSTPSAVESSHMAKRDESDQSMEAKGVTYGIKVCS